MNNTYSMEYLKIIVYTDPEEMYKK